MSQRKTIAIIQARMGSSRFPGKMLSSIAGRPVIAWVLQQAKRARRCQEVVVATSDQRSDDALAAWCEAAGTPVFRGSERDVLSRFHGCASRHGADRIVRLTGDCPLLDPQIIDDVVELCEHDATVDYATNCEPATFPEGMSAECIPMCVLQHMQHHASDPRDREHVTLFVRLRPESYRHATLEADPDLSHLRMTVDYPQDRFALDQLVTHLFEQTPQAKLTLNNLLQALNQRPDLQQILQQHQRDLWRQEVSRDERRIA